MGFTLVYTGEHYVSDIGLGWIYAALTFAAVSAAARMAARRRPATTMAAAQRAGGGRRGAPSPAMRASG
jgi:hypothetical protein